MRSRIKEALILLSMVCPCFRDIQAMLFLFLAAVTESGSSILRVE
jgi:hypothetical protein